MTSYARRDVLGDGVLNVEIRHSTLPISVCFANGKTFGCNRHLHFQNTTPKVVVFLMWRDPFSTSSPKAYRLTNKPMTMSCIWIDFEKQIVFRTKRLIRVRSVRCLRSIFWVFCLPGLCISGSRWRSYAPQ